MQQVDFLITSYNRFALLDKLMGSIYKYYPNASVMVADQSKEGTFPSKLKRKYKKAKFYHLEEDCGLSFTRNFLVNKSRKKYKLLLEDDFLFCDETRVEDMIEIMRHIGCGVVGGSVYQNGHELSFDFNFKRIGSTLTQVRQIGNWQQHKELRYRYVQCVMNFTLFNSEVFNDIIWDNDLKLREHQDFYLRLSKTKHKVVYCPDIKIVDNKFSEPVTNDYKNLKARDEFMVHMMKKHGLDKIVYHSGSIYELEGDKLYLS